MNRRLLMAAVAACVVGVPVQAQAQAWCTHPGGGACFNVTSFSFVSVFDPVADLTTIDTRLAGTWSGPLMGGFTNFVWNFWVSADTQSGPLTMNGIGTGLSTPAQGQFATSGPLGATPQDANDVLAIDWWGRRANGQTASGSCTTDPASFNPCLAPPVQAPEPASAALALAGILGLGGVARRRRRAATD